MKNIFAIPNKLGQSSEARVSYFLVFLTFILVLTGYLYAQHQLRKNVDSSLEITGQMLGPAPNTFMQAVPGEDLPEVKFKNPMGRGAISINLGKRIRAGVLELKLAPESGVVHNYYRVRIVELKDKSLGIRSSNLVNSPWVNIRPDNLVYRLPLSRSSVKQHFFLEIQYSGNVPGILFESITLKEANYSDYPVAALLTGILVFMAMFIPGMLLFSLIPALHFFPAVPGMFLGGCVFMLFTLAVDKLSGIAWLNPALLVTLLSAFIVIPNLRNKIKAFLCQLGTTDHQAINLTAAASLVIVVLLAFGHPSALRNVDQGHITMDHGFFAFSAHDSVFQHANAKSVLEGDFHKYYGNYQLMAKPQDREILPGLIYASLMRWLSWAPADIDYLYFPYGVFFLISNILFLSVLFYWLQPLPNKVIYGALAVVATTPAFWVMAVVGWFKLTGAAIFLAGLYAVRKKPGWIWSWFLAGCLFGLSKNFHAGNILVAPVFFLWILWIAYRHEKLPVGKLGIYGASLVTGAVLFTLPWMVFVKQVWNVGSHTLFTYHFLAGHYDPGSLLQSVRLFFQEYSFEQQLSFRFNALITAFNPSWLIQVLTDDLVISKDKAASWMKISASYFLPAIIPAVLFVLVTRLVRWVSLSAEEGTESAVPANPWRDQLGWVCLIGMVFLILASWAELAITWHFPTLLIFGLIAAVITYRFSRSMVGYELLYILAGLQSGLLIVYG